MPAVDRTWASRAYRGSEGEHCLNSVFTVYISGMAFCWHGRPSIRTSTGVVQRWRGRRPSSRSPSRVSCQALRVCSPYMHRSTRHATVSVPRMRDARGYVHISTYIMVREAWRTVTHTRASGWFRPTATAAARARIFDLSSLPAALTHASAATLQQCLSPAASSPAQGALFCLPHAQPSGHALAL